MKKNPTTVKTMPRGIQIFKECPDGKLTMQEMDAICSTSVNNYKFNDDRANGILAFALFNVTRDEADSLVNRLNSIVEEDATCMGQEAKIYPWFLGDPDEEYVFTD